MTPRPLRTLPIAAALVAVLALSAHADPLRVMTFNIRFDGGGVGSVFAENGWLNRCGPRREMVPIVVQGFDPDILGVQEALKNQVDDLVEALPGYELYGVGRDDGDRKGEFSGIFFRDTRFERVDAGTFWLSETPDVPGTVFPGSGSIRIASWVILDDLANGAQLLVLNTHWDNASQSSRERSAALVRDRIEALAGARPVVVMGDLNASPGSTAVRTLLGVSDPLGLQLVDGYREVHPMVEPDEATFHGFGGGTAGSRIDYVVHTDFFTATAGTIDRTSFSCGYPSDHYAVSAVLAGPGDVLMDDANSPEVLADPCVPGCTVGGCGTVTAAPAPGPAVPSAATLAVVGLAIGAFALRGRGRRSA